LNNDVSAFRELFASDPTCIVQDLSSYASPDDMINSPLAQPAAIENVKPAKSDDDVIMYPHNRSKTILLEMMRTDSGDSVKLPSNEGVTASISVVPRFSSGNLRKHNQVKPATGKKVTLNVPPPSPAHYQNANYQKFNPNPDDELYSPRKVEALKPELPKREPKRIFIRSKTEIEKTNPYVIFEKTKGAKPALDTITNNQFVKSLNRLYRLRPPKTWSVLEQEALTYKYCTDRARFGSHVMESEPVPVDDSDIDSSLYFDDDDDDEVPIIKLEMLPNNVEVLKQMVINLQKQLKQT
jgi:hypothetical protein